MQRQEHCRAAMLSSGAWPRSAGPGRGPAAGSGMEEAAGGGGGWAGCPATGQGACPGSGTEAGGRGDGSQPQQPPGAIPAAEPGFTPCRKAGERYTPLASPKHPLLSLPTQTHHGGSLCRVHTPSMGVGTHKETGPETPPHKHSQPPPGKGSSWAKTSTPRSRLPQNSLL